MSRAIATIPFVGLRGPPEESPESTRLAALCPRVLHHGATLDVGGGADSEQHLVVVCLALQFQQSVCLAGPARRRTSVNDPPPGYPMTRHIMELGSCRWPGPRRGCCRLATRGPFAVGNRFRLRELQCFGPHPSWNGYPHRPPGAVELVACPRSILQLRLTSPSNASWQRPAESRRYSGACR